VILTKAQEISMDARTQEDQEGADATEVFSIYSTGKPDLARAQSGAARLQTSEVQLKERAFEGHAQETATLSPFEAGDVALNPSLSVNGGATETTHAVLYNRPIRQSSELEMPKTHYSTLASAKPTSAATAHTVNGMEASTEHDTAAIPARHEVQFHQPQPNTLYADETTSWSDESFHKPLAPGSMSPEGRVAETPEAVGDRGSSHRPIPRIDFLSERPGVLASVHPTGLTDCGSTPCLSTSDLSASKMIAPLPTLEPRVDLARRVERGRPFLPEPLHFTRMRKNTGWAWR
jgi:hypothetical protein